MGRLPEELVERIKREISVQRLAEVRGVKLKRSGKELIGLCPFHKDTNPSLNIDPAQNVWHCKGCGKKGSVIDWVMLAEGISVRYALELLRRDYLPSAAGATEPPPKISTMPKLPPLFEPAADDQKVLAVVVDYYHETLKNSTDSPKAKQYLWHRGLQSSEMIERFRLGFSNRTLNYHLSKKNRVVGAEMRGRLETLGILREKTGHEHFVGSLVIPILNLNGEVVQMYGRKITPRNKLRENTPEHLYLPGALRGVWNEAALIASKEIILCEALIDALTFWCAGYRHVTSIYGVNNFTGEHRAAFQKHGTKRIYLAYDRDDAGEDAAQAHATELMAMGIECFRVKFPKDMDANEYARMTQPAAKALGVLLHSAEWLGKGKRPTVAGIEPPPAEEISEPQSAATNPETRAEMKSEEQPAAPMTAEETNPAAKEENAISLPTPPTVEDPEKVFPVAAEPQALDHEEAAPVTMPPPAALSPLDMPTAMKANGALEITLRERRYTVRGLQKNTSPDGLRCTVTVAGMNGRGELSEHTDTLDFYSAQRRAVFVKQAAQEVGVKEDFLRQELGKVRMKLEAMRDEQIEKTLGPKPKEETTMAAEEQAEALALLRDPRLLDRVLEDFEKCGVVGEETNKRIAYLAAVSRLLEKPLAIVVQSASSAGKSSLMEAVLDFVPEEQRESYTAMTGQALFYMGQKNLKHKILAISEQQGADRASYPLKLLQSEGKLNIASTGKDPVSGKLVTHDYEVEGPVMLFLTTTAHEVDEELLNRCIALTVNEDREQTRAIHRQQREARTIEGHLLRRKRAKLVRLHRNAQRLLRPLAVVNNHDVGEFPDTMTRARRDHNKLLTLIEAIALLHQYQRKTKTIPCDGDTLEYIEATEADVNLAQALADQVGLKPSLDELRPQPRKLLCLISEMAKDECERLQIEINAYRFTRRTVREYTRWGDTQLRQHLKRLEEMEYLVVRRGGNQGQQVVYQLATAAEEETHRSANFAGSNEDFAGTSRALRGPEKNDESSAMTRVSSSTSRLRGIAYRGEAPGGPQNAVVVVPKPNGTDKPNGHGLAKRAAGE